MKQSDAFHPLGVTEPSASAGLSPVLLGTASFVYLLDIHADDGHAERLGK